MSCGRKYNEWEIKGVPIRLEIGQEELNNGTLRLVRRCDNQKREVKMEGIEDTIQQEFIDIKKTMFEKAKNKF